MKRYTERTVKKTGRIWFAGAKTNYWTSCMKMKLREICTDYGILPAKEGRAALEIDLSASCRGRAFPFYLLKIFLV